MEKLLDLWQPTPEDRRRFLRDVDPARCPTDLAEAIADVFAGMDRALGLDPALERICLKTGSLIELVLETRHGIPSEDDYQIADMESSEDPDTLVEQLAWSGYDIETLIGKRRAWKQGGHLGPPAAYLDTNHIVGALLKTTGCDPQAFVDAVFSVSPDFFEGGGEWIATGRPKGARTRTGATEVDLTGVDGSKLPWCAGKASPYSITIHTISLAPGTFLKLESSSSGFDAYSVRLPEVLPLSLSSTFAREPLSELISHPLLDHIPLVIDHVEVGKATKVILSAISRSYDPVIPRPPGFDGKGPIRCVIEDACRYYARKRDVARYGDLNPHLRDQMPTLAEIQAMFPANQR